MIIRHRTILRFTLVEMALAIVGVGLSAVLLLSTIGAKAGRDGRVEGKIEEAAEQMTAFLQSRFSAPANWKADGTSTDVIPNFVASPADGDVPVGSAGFSPVPGQEGILSKDVGTYICAVNGFEAMVRLGVDGSFWGNQFYVSPADGTVKKLTEYPLTHSVPVGTRINGASSPAMFGKFFRPLIVELSWPIDAAWSEREKRLIRLDLFNENFVPYPQS